jgi:hypothetical protein
MMAVIYGALASSACIDCLASALMGGDSNSKSHGDRIMALKVSKVDVWAADIEDKAGSVASKLDALADAGVNLQFAIARRTPEKPGHGVVFVTPVKGAKRIKAAREAGFSKTDSLHSVCVEGSDKLGRVSVLTKRCADAGINLRGVSAAALGRKCVIHLAFDTADDATNAMSKLRKK